MHNQFSPHIHVNYPPNNNLIFEEWFAQRYKQEDNISGREYLPVFWTSYFVNNNYANDQKKVQELQDYIDTLDRNKKYFTLLQYDDGCIVDFKDLDIVVFGASGKKCTYDIPLLCQPHPYVYNEERNIFCTFIGSPTHKIRERIIDIPESNIHIPDRQPIAEYCRTLAKSVFSLCPRGYGINSFRIAESVQYGAIPVYISDDFSMPMWMDFEDFGILVHMDNTELVMNILQSFTPEEIQYKQQKCKEAYEKYYSYESNYRYIIKTINDRSKSIEYRKQLPELLVKAGLPMVAAEIGVAEGKFSRKLLEGGITDLLLVDRWISVSTEKGNGSEPQKWHDDNLKAVEGLSEEYAGKCRIHRGDSSQIAGYYPDNYFSLIYLDADHSYEGVKKDIEAWYHKVAPGGIISGHDYLNKDYGVNKAINEFCKNYGITGIKVIPEDEPRNASFYFIKPII